MHLRSSENKILSERKNSSFQILNFGASSLEEPRQGEERNSEVSRGAEQFQSLSSHCPPAGAQRRTTSDRMILDPDSYQPIPSPPTSPILYFPPSHSTNIILLEFYIKPKRREENIFYSISKFILLPFLQDKYIVYIHVRGEEERTLLLPVIKESKVDKVHISLR